MRQRLEQRGVTLLLSTRADSAEAGCVKLRDGARLSADCVLWATGTTGPPLFRAAGLPVDPEGFLRVADTMQCPSATWLFAAGDCATLAGHPALKKIGVHAVKQGPTLRANVDAALDAYRLAMLTQPGEYQWRIGEAQALQSLGHSREAAAIYQSLLADDPVGTDIWLAQADIWIHLDQPLRAVANLEIVHRSGALDPSATLSLGHLYHQSSLPDLALERYRAAILAEEPVRLARAVDALEILTNASDWERAKELAGLIESSEVYRAALADDDKTDKGLASRLTRSRALIELENGDADAGAKLVEDWLAREPLDGLSLILLARFREGKDRIEEAIMLLEQAERIPEHAAAAHLAHGQILVTQSRYEEAVEQLEKSHEIKPGKAVADYLKAVRELR